MKKLNLAIVGCGNISGIYFKNITTRFNSLLEIVACVDLDIEKANTAAKEYNIPQVLSLEEVLKDPTIDLIVNLTIPVAHAEVTLQALSAGKHVYLEKPLAITRDDGAKMVSLAKEKNLLLGCAPETFMGGGIQTCIELINDGIIGTPVAGACYMMCHGHESWHPAPEFYYKSGGGPLFDMGPYYLSALIALLGPALRVTGSIKKTFPQRTITSEPLNGTIIDVDVPTHLSSIIDFKNGTTVTLTTSFDIWHHSMRPIEIYGSEGSLRVPDPNTFGGPVEIRLKGESEWREVPITFSNTENSRGVGVYDMAKSLIENRSHLVNGNLAYHVLDLMHAIHESSETGMHVTLGSTCDKPEQMPKD